MMLFLRMLEQSKRASACKLSPKEGVATYQFVGGVMAYQDYDA
jgi:hypothetical protein